ncbi:MAG: TrmH family RNA methyltransferase [Spirochaetaceae bacterium]|jgi:TrmH family RNA methyltransferase|nr:TrmH family RNA methyltransferase [Spirochaetaceae bacterium]
MIPIPPRKPEPFYKKLGKLPRSLRLRKAVKLLEETERRLRVGREAPAADLPALLPLLALLALDVPASDAGLVRDVRDALEAAPPDPRLLLRRVNALRHRILAETGNAPSDWDFIDDTGALDGAKRLVFEGVRVYLEDLRSPFNVGAVFRASESFGVEKIFLSPLCADPRHKRATRTAQGCVSLLPWERLPLEALLAPGVPLFALETGGTPVADFPFPPRGVLLAGSEELGLSPEALAAADTSLGRVSVTTYGAKGSLNVSVAFGITMHAWAGALLRRAAPTG